MLCHATLVMSACSVRELYRHEIGQYVHNIVSQLFMLSDGNFHI